MARRFAALMVDWAACVAVSSLFADPVRDGWPPVVVLVAVYAVFVGLFAQTPGMWVAKIRCVSYADGGRIGVFRALLRGLLLVLVVPALIMDGERRGLHDRLAGSVIVPLDGPTPAAARDR
ncbi:RDD family protein [Polymorphospora rubra]|uniref:RDD family protein n=1 Tax=Polymorphospora rubra TaxID=338584 RepID=UPI003CCEBF2C